jgi:type I restriction enzyme S subunit
MTKTVKLDDIFYPVSETFQFTDKKVIFLNTSDIEWGKFLHSNYSTPKTLPGQAKKRIKKNDILFSEIRPANGRFALVTMDDTADYVVSTKLLVLRVKENIFPEWAYIMITAPDMLRQLQTIAESRSGTFPQITFDTIKNIEINLPDLKRQREVAEILGSLGEKIALNRAQISTLSELGQTLFRHYFIDNPDTENWEEVRLGEIANVTDYVANGSFAALKENVTLYDDEDYALFVRTTDYKGGFSGNLKYTDEKSFNFLKKSRLFGSEVIVSNVGDVGTVFRPPTWLNRPMTLGSNAVMITKSDFNHYLFFYLSSPEGQFAISGITAGSAQPKFNKTEFRNLRVLNPHEQTIDAFNRVYDAVLAQIKNCQSEIHTLTTLRNTLLPKLIE